MAKGILFAILFGIAGDALANDSRYRHGFAQKTVIVYHKLSSMEWTMGWKKFGGA